MRQSRTKKTDVCLRLCRKTKNRTKTQLDITPIICTSESHLSGLYRHNHTINLPEIYPKFRTSFRINCTSSGCTSVWAGFFIRSNQFAMVPNRNFAEISPKFQITASSNPSNCVRLTTSMDVRNLVEISPKFQRHWKEWVAMATHASWRRRRMASTK